MKKLFLFVAVAALTISLNSCSSSSESSSPGGTLTVKINGTSKTFNTVVVNEEVFDAGTPDEYTELTVIASIDASITERIIFYLNKGDVGTNTAYGFAYFKDGQSYYEDAMANNLTTNNNNKKLAGNFSGTLTNSIDTITFTNGSFNIQY